MPCSHFSECIVSNMNVGSVGSSIPMPMFENVIAPVVYSVDIQLSYGIDTCYMI